MPIVLSVFLFRLILKLGSFLPELTQESTEELKRSWNKFAVQVTEALLANQNELPEQHIKAFITTKKAFGPSFQIERRHLDELNVLISKFSTQMQPELVQEWNELYKNF